MIEILNSDWLTRASAANGRRVGHRLARVHARELNQLADQFLNRVVLLGFKTNNRETPRL